MTTVGMWAAIGMCAVMVVLIFGMAALFEHQNKREAAQDAERIKRAGEQL